MFQSTFTSQARRRRLDTIETATAFQLRGLWYVHRLSVQTIVANDQSNETYYPINLLSSQFCEQSAGSATEGQDNLVAYRPPLSSEYTVISIVKPYS